MRPTVQIDRFYVLASNDDVIETRISQSATRLLKLFPLRIEREDPTRRETSNNFSLSLSFSPSQSIVHSLLLTSKVYIIQSSILTLTHSLVQESEEIEIRSTLSTSFLHVYPFLGKGGEQPMYVFVGSYS